VNRIINSGKNMKNVNYWKRYGFTSRFWTQKD